MSGRAPEKLWLRRERGGFGAGFPGGNGAGFFGACIPAIQLQAANRVMGCRRDPPPFAVEAVGWSLWSSNSVTVKMHKNGGVFLGWRPRAARNFLEMAAGDSEETLDFMKMVLFFYYILMIYYLIFLRRCYGRKEHIPHA